MNRWIDRGLLGIRVGLGLMFIFVHGGPKLLSGPQRWEILGGAMRNMGIDFAPVFWGLMASSAECFGGLLILLGLFTRAAAFFMVVTLFVAAVGHFARNQGIAGASHAIEVGVALLGILIAGAGRYSLDEWRKRHL